jgi:hypothetical protein
VPDDDQDGDDVHTTLPPDRVQCPHCLGFFDTDTVVDHVSSCPRRPRNPRPR